MDGSGCIALTLVVVINLFGDVLDDQVGGGDLGYCAVILFSHMRNLRPWFASSWVRVGLSSKWSIILESASQEKGALDILSCFRCV